MISTAVKDGYNYLCIVMNAKMYDCDDDGVDENMAFMLTKQLYEWAFDNVRLREVANPNVFVGYEVQVRLSKEYDYVSLVPAESISALVPVNVGTESVYYEPYPDQTAVVVDAPVKKGDILGRAAIKYSGETIAEVDLVAAFDVNRSTTKYIGSIIMKIVRSTFFKVIAVFVFVVFLPGFILFFVIYPRKRRSKKNSIKMVDVKRMDKNQRRKG